MTSSVYTEAFRAILVVALFSHVLALNYCGTDFADAQKCESMCPSGLDSECPDGERCFADVSCSPPSASVDRYCGTNFAAASGCQSACLGGLDAECPSGETCFADVVCSSPPPTQVPQEQPSPSHSESSHSTVDPSPTAIADSGNDSNFCGKDYSSSLECAVGCPSGLDEECPKGERCFARVPCLSRPPPSDSPDPADEEDGQAQQLSGRPSLSPLEIVGIVAGVIAFAVIVEEVIRRCWWKRRSQPQRLPTFVE